MELHQSPPFIRYIKLLHWNVETVDGQQIFFKRVPLMGTMVKMQRMHPLPQINHLLPILKKYRVKRAVIEASEYEHEQTFREWCDQLRTEVKIVASPYLPSKTLRIDLTPAEENIFQSFSEAKRRAVRRAMKNNITIKEEPSIHDLIKIKNKSAGFLGFITTSGLKELWQTFGPDNATTVLAFDNNKAIGGILLLFWEDIAYYWIAGATREGKKLFVPTLLAWEAMKIAKKRGTKWFDWVGVWDERFPKESHDWKGFTKFKEGFGGKTIYYPTHR